MSVHKKLFVVSDIHGYYTLLENALKKAGYEKDNENHLLICLGDYFDRGTENREVLKFFERLKNKVLLKGNHEDLLIKLLQTGKIQPHNYINGTLSTLEEFFGKYFVDPVDDSIDFSGKTRIVDRICEFIDEAENYFETEKYVFVHGWIPQGCSSSADLKSATNEQWAEARKVRWSEKYDGEKPLSDKTVVCGHMPTFFANIIDRTRERGSTEIFYGNGLIAIDAGTHDSKNVNVLILEEY